MLLIWWCCQHRRVQLHDDSPSTRHCCSPTQPTVHPVREFNHHWEGSSLSHWIPFFLQQIASYEGPLLTVYFLLDLQHDVSLLMNQFVLLQWIDNKYSIIPLYWSSVYLISHEWCLIGVMVGKQVLQRVVYMRYAALGDAISCLWIKNCTMFFIFLVIWLTKILRGTELASSLYAWCFLMLGRLFSHEHLIVLQLLI